MFTLRSLAAAALLVLPLGGCMDPTSMASTDTQFVGGSADSIVVIGMRSTMPILKPTERYYPDFRMWWNSLPEPGMRAGTPHKVIIGTDEHNETFGDRHAGEISIHVVRVPPGTYYLHGIKSEIAESFYRLQPVSGPGTPFFTVKAGEVRYIGDMHCDVISQPARCDKLTRSDRLAFTMLQQYPGIRVKPQFRAPAYLPGGEDPARVMAVSD
ncbi:hypothetical protein FNB15_14910 [Ferrovibrio terrae]|uniref:DUF2846 domain-containing protein n=1 Tax=Ferrovibrio terrae TaxID=2594003 RepID=A0A516H3Z1_9PROT|nr:hypothetical protein [Ferrovibrio terrae]QDO98489.1 hypothetical protein FNB15_14910 [Ferrovibrio terrae]